MARRRRTSLVEDLMGVVAGLPWWAGIALAVVSYLFLHSVAGREAVINGRPGQIGVQAVHAVWTSLATIAQYAVPLICLVGAGISGLKRKKRSNLVEDAGKSAALLSGMNWREFELLVGEAFRLRGYRVVETGGAGADGGVDLQLSKGSEKFLVQCKQWRAFKVGVEVVRELYGAMAAEGAAGGIVVTSGRFTADAVRFASGRNVELIDGPLLHDLLCQVRQTKSSAPTAPVVQPRGSVAVDVASPPDCPVCTKTMTKRVAKRGPKAGAEFWGCPAYPACRGTRQAS